VLLAGLTSEPVTDTRNRCRQPMESQAPRQAPATGHRLGRLG